MTSDPTPDQPRLLVRDRAVLHRGHSYDFEELTVAYPDGINRTKPIVRHRGAACIIPIIDSSSESGRGAEIVLVRNDRVTIEDVLLEVPAGGIDAGEDPIVAATRELEEETGYRAATVEPLGRFYTTPGMTDELMHVFVARGLKHVGQKLEPYESLTVHRFSPGDLLGMIERGEVLDGKTILALLLAVRKGVLAG